MNPETLVLCFALFLIAALYSSVGHGGASGYLAILSLSTFATLNAAWLKQHAWVLNLVVASLAFYHYQKAGYHRPKLSFVFIIASLPAAFFGGTLAVDGAVYDTLLSFALIFAAIRLSQTTQSSEPIEEEPLPSLQTTVPIGASIGVLSGMIGVGGGIFLSPILNAYQNITVKIVHVISHTNEYLLSENYLTTQLNMIEIFLMKSTS